MPSLIVNIVTGPQPHNLVTLAGTQLVGIITRLFGLVPRLSCHPLSNASVRIYLVPADGQKPDDEQAFILRRSEVDSKPAMVAVGGSPVATLWAAYELAEQWGVCFLLTEDIYPENPGPFVLPDINKTWTPRIRTRAWRIVNCLPHCGAYWGIADYNKLFIQLSKQKYNRIWAWFRTYDAFTDYTFDGLRKRTVEISRGQRFPLHDKTIGRHVIDDATSFYNPDLPAEPDTLYEADPETDSVNEQRHEAGQRHIQAVIDLCHARGLEFAAGFWYTEFPVEIKKQLKIASDRHGFKPRPFKGEYGGLRIGVMREGIMPEYSPYMTPLNPDFQDLAESVARSYVDRYPHADQYIFCTLEFSTVRDDAEECWLQLKERHGIDEDFKTLLDEALAAGDVGPERNELDLRLSICQFHLLDELINHRKVIANSANPEALIVIQAGPVMARFVPRIFNDVEIMSSLGYTAFAQSQRTNLLGFTQEEKVKTQIIISIEDDNIGESPQYNASMISKLYDVMDEYELDGYYGRQWLISKVDPAAYYMAHANWDKSVSVDQSYRDLVVRTCGSAAVDDAVAAFRAGEQVTAKEFDLATSFLVADVITRNFEHAAGPEAQPWQIPQSWLENIDIYQNMVDHFDAAIVKARPAGRPFLDRLREQAIFAIHWHKSRGKVSQGGHLRKLADHARDQEQDVETYDRLNFEVVAALDVALVEMKLAIEAYSRSVADRADQGTVAALNVYMYESLEAIRKLEFQKMIWWAQNGKA